MHLKISRNFSWILGTGNTNLHFASHTEKGFCYLDFNKRKIISVGVCRPMNAGVNENSGGLNLAVTWTIARGSTIIGATFNVSNSLVGNARVTGFSAFAFRFCVFSVVIKFSVLYLRRFQRPRVHCKKKETFLTDVKFKQPIYQKKRTPK